MNETCLRQMVILVLFFGSKFDTPSNHTKVNIKVYSKLISNSVGKTVSKSKWFCVAVRCWMVANEHHERGHGFAYKIGMAEKWQGPMVIGFFNWVWFDFDRYDNLILEQTQQMSLLVSTRACWKLNHKYPLNTVENKKHYSGWLDCIGTPESSLKKEKTLKANIKIISEIV